MQNNVNPGPILRRTAGADLTDKTNFIVMIDDANEVVLHDGTLAKPYLLLTEGGDGDEVEIQALAGAAMRVKTAGVFDPTVPVYLDVATGKASATASALRLGFAEESKATGEGNILMRPEPVFAPIGTLALLAMDAGAAYTEAQIQAIADKVDALITALKLAR